MRQTKVPEISLEREYSQDIPLLNSDASMIQQVLFNIFNNALEAMAEKKYMEEQPCFHLKLYTEADYAIIEIEDNGPGIEAVSTPGSFTRFVIKIPLITANKASED